MTENFGIDFVGFGCDTAAVINVLAHRDAAQRALIQQEYRAMYSEELSKRLKSELSGKVEVNLLVFITDYSPICVSYYLFLSHSIFSLTFSVVPSKGSLSFLCFLIFFFF